MLNVTAWLPFVAMALLVGAVLLCMRYLIPSKEAAEAFFNETLDTHRRNKWEQLAREKLILRYLQPILLLLGTSFRNWSAPDYRPQVTRKLVAAGFPLALNFETYCGLIVLSAAGGLLLGIYISLGLLQEMSPPLLVLGLSGGAYMPVLWLNEKLQQRRWQISKELPYKIDLITLCVEAGLDLQSAIEHVVKRDTTDSPLREELFHMLQEIRVGKTRRVALREMSERLGIDSLTSLVGNINQAEAMGTPVGHVLRVQADMMRVQRSNRAEKLAGEAPVKIIFPLLFIFMAVCLVLFGSIIVRSYYGEFDI